MRESPSSSSRPVPVRESLCGQESSRRREAATEASPLFAMLELRRGFRRKCWRGRRRVHRCLDSHLAGTDARDIRVSSMCSGCRAQLAGVTTFPPGTLPVGASMDGGRMEGSGEELYGLPFSVGGIRDRGSPLGVA